MGILKKMDLGFFTFRYVMIEIIKETFQSIGDFFVGSAIFFMKLMIYVGIFGIALYFILSLLFPGSVPKN
jgi:hypothetical protein